MHPFARSIAAGLLSATAALSCQCAGDPPVCSAFWKMALVFLGRVDSVSAADRDGDGFPLVHVSFHVLERVRGDLNSDAVVDTPQGGPTCGINLQQGKSYLVYAYKANDRFRTDHCTRTHVVLNESTDPDLRWIRALSKTGPNPSIVGNIRALIPRDGGFELAPLSDVVVTVSGPKNTQARSNAEGVFQIPDLSLGSYSVSIATPPGFQPGDPRTILLTDQACGVAEWDLHRRP
jgi:hypothetical protein